MEVVSAKGIVVDGKDLGAVDASLLRAVVLKERKPLFVFGPGVSLDAILRQFDIVPRIYVARKPDDPTVRATGVFARAGGGYYTVNIISKVEIALRELMARIDAAVDRMLGIDKMFPTDARVQKSQWADDGSTHEEDIQDPGTKGVFRQRVTMAFLKDDGSDKSDWWYLHIYNEVEPAPGYMTRANNSSAKAVEATAVPCWGPRGTVGKLQRAEVVVGCPGPRDRWEWSTGFTTVEDKTVGKEREARWVVSFEPGGKDSKALHRWEPGVQYETSDTRRKQLVIRMMVSVEWEDQRGKAVPWPLDPWEYVSMPPR